MLTYLVLLLRKCSSHCFRSISLQSGELASMKAKVDESEGQKTAFEDHIKTLKVRRYNHIALNLF